MDCKKEKNLNNRCNCTHSGCPRAGVCCDCIAYHVQNRQLPACCFPQDAEKTYNRSFKYFAELVNSDKI